MNKIDFNAILKQLLYDPTNPLLFSSGFFLYFFTTFISLYYLFRNSANGRAIVLSFFSLYFFYKASGNYVILVIITAIVVYTLGIILEGTHRRSIKKLILGISVVFNLGLLFYFKYTNFFITIWNNSAQQDISPLHLILPIGISFYTFENLSYTIDVYKGEIKPERNFLHYLLFLSFFPKLVMGPIVRAKDFIPQLKEQYYVSRESFLMGFYLILTGLFKKIIISDFISTNLVDYIFDNPTLHTGYENLVAVYGYAAVIYCDFSGYSDTAIGIAYWLGIKIPANFLSPYQSSSVTEFWKRWHISLSSWLQDYLYIFALGGNRKSATRTYINLIVTMLIGGFWHGANWTFIIWGGLHGIGLVVNKFWSRLIPTWIGQKWYYKTATVILTFHFICFCWIFFKSTDLTTSLAVISQITGQFSLDGIEQFWGNYRPVLLMILFAFSIHFIPDRLAPLILGKYPTTIVVSSLALFFAILLSTYMYLKTAEPIMPIYLQF